MTRYLSFLISLVLPASLLAQADRYELGQRLRSFEKTWERVEDRDAKQRTITPLDQAVRSFFSFNFAAVAEHLDKAQLALLSSDPPSSAVLWSYSLAFRPERRLIDATSKQLHIQIKSLYEVSGEVPQGASVRMQLAHREPIALNITSLPQTCTLPLENVRPGDHPLTVEVIVAGEPLVKRKIVISCASELALRLEKVKNVADQLRTYTTMEQATLPHLLKMATDLASGAVLETDIPAARILDESEQLAQAILEGKPFYLPQRSGQFWLRIPVGRSLAIVRVFIPEGLNASEPVPVVFALHGAGGSENLFFDGYGDGITAKLCKERGWIMVAPRAGGPLGFGGTPNVVGILEELAKRYPVDTKRVYLIGHSMGAGHAVAIAQQSPERFAGVAVLGGGGTLRKVDAVKSLPFFIGVGKHDFARGAARNLAEALRNANVTSYQFTEYDNVEHTMIVREAAPDVFQFWERR